MNRSTYSLLWYLALPLVLLRLAAHARASADLRLRWRERLGCYPAAAPSSTPGAPRILFHAVSVGEVHAGLPLIRALRQSHPGFALAITTTTPTGAERVQALLGDAVEHYYLPVDTPGAVRRFLDHLQPDLLVVMETELWPNLLHGCRSRGIRLLLANARLSERSSRGYARLGRLSREMLAGLDCVAAQSTVDGERLCRLGLPPERLVVTGSLKFEVKMNEAQLNAGRGMRGQWGRERPVLIAASTREGEDAKVLRAFALLRRELPDCVLVLVPRHPERFDEAAQLAVAEGLRVLRRSAWQAQEDYRGIDLLVGDSMGEMALYYGMADLAFVGGSLVDTGCQNVLEPVALGLPVLTGPSLYNFQEISDRLREAGAQRVLADEGELAQVASALLGDAPARARMAAAGERVMRQNRGATERTLTLIEGLLPQPAAAGSAPR